MARVASVVAPRGGVAVGAAASLDGVARMPAPPVSASSPGPGVPRSASGQPIQVRRSGVTSLPVSGNGSIAAGVATSVAGEVARSAAEEAVAERLQRSSSAGSSTQIARSVDGDGRLRVQRAVGDDVDGGPAIDLEAQKDELLRFTMTDEFEERLLEFLEDRLLGEIERRGGRYGGWFA
ncbi:MAG: hypothetical protein KC458_07250 [Dehalococcoidia bacterium]|nr:hypothetical protein [Dehalococcoidia bacterium]